MVSIFVTYWAIMLIEFVQHCSILCKTFFFCIHLRNINQRLFIEIFNILNTKVFLPARRWH